MSYAEITFKDKNLIKRWLQQQRLESAIRLFNRSTKPPETICDFGAGNGELCKLLSKQYKKAKLICYEPTPDLLSEARQNLGATGNVAFYEDAMKIPPETIDVVFCLEVFEHLPPKETTDALETVNTMLKPGGYIVIGVPVEIGLPALYKGIFRMSRRYGEFDACIKNVALSFFLCPPKTRPVSEIAPGFNFYFPHMGFNFRHFKSILNSSFSLQKEAASPFSMFGSWLMPEIYFLAQKVR